MRIYYFEKKKYTEIPIKSGLFHLSKFINLSRLSSIYFHMKVISLSKRSNSHVQRFKFYTILISFYPRKRIERCILGFLTIFSLKKCYKKFQNKIKNIIIQLLRDIFEMATPIHSWGDIFEIQKISDLEKKANSKQNI